MPAATEGSSLRAAGSLTYVGAVTPPSVENSQNCSESMRSIDNLDRELGVGKFSIDNAHLLLAWNRMRSGGVPHDTGWLYVGLGDPAGGGLGRAGRLDGGFSQISGCPPL